MQGILWRNRCALTGDGMLYPGGDPAAHHRAAVDLLPGRYEGWVDPGTAGAWQWLIEQVSAWSGSSVISSELLALADPRTVDEVLALLSFAEVHIVCTARDLVRQIPSVWQEDVKNRRTTPFSEFVGHVRDGRQAEISDLFWSYQDLPAVLGTWTRGVPRERVHVVTVPPRGAPAGLLWQRFAPVLGIDPARCDTGVPQHNSSLDLAGTELVRRLNEVLGDSVPWPEYVRIVKDHLAEDVLPRHRTGGPIVLSGADQTWAAEMAARHVSCVADAGYQVAGDLSDLLPEPTAQHSTAGAGDAEVADAAVHALAEIVRRAARPETGERSGPGVKRFLLDLSGQHHQVMAMRRMYWRAKARLHRFTDSR